jgi:hypothetical protein
MEPGEVQCRNNGFLSATICGQSVGHLPDQFHIEAGDTNPFIGIHGWKYKWPKRFNRDSNTDLSFRTNGGQFMGCKGMYQFHSIEDKSASL